MRRMFTLACARPRLALAGLLLTSFVVRLALSWGKQQPLLLPDEYIYAELSRGLFAGPDVRETSFFNFIPLLEPLITWPFWTGLDTFEAYRAVQGLHSLLFALAAVPVYAAARRAGVTTGWALACAGLALLIPDLVYVGFASSEALGYLVFCSWLWVALGMLTTPRLKWAAALIALSGLATLSRMQLVVLPLAYLVAAAAQTLIEPDRRRQLRQQAPAVVPLLLVGLAAAAVKGSGALGSYAGVVDWWQHPGLLKWMAYDLYVLMWNSGLVLLPAGLLALALALYAPMRREHRSFALLALPLFLFLLIEGAYYATDPDTPYFGEAVHARYFFYLCPIVFVAFALYATRPRGPAALSVLALGAILAVNQVPLSSLAHASAFYSPLLQGVLWADRVLGGPFRSRPYLFLLSALLFLGLILLTKARPYWAPRIAVAVAAGLLAFSSFGAHDTVNVYSDATTTKVFGAADKEWVKSLGVDSVMLVPTNADRAAVEVLAFWKPSLRPALLPDSTPPDAFSYDPVLIAEDGVVSDQDGPLSGTVIFLAETAYAEATVQKSASSLPAVTLWRTDQPLQLKLLVDGYYQKLGWLAEKGTLRLWPAEGPLAGYVEIRPKRRDGNARLAIEAPGYRQEHPLVSIPSVIRIPVCSDGPWLLRFRADGDDLLRGATLERGTPVSAEALLPRFSPDPAACRD